jgi:glucosamine 6-phosphate synthetase-like amidotransferase/phosphosugar isomerase protein
MNGLEQLKTRGARVIVFCDESLNEADFGKVEDLDKVEDDFGKVERIIRIPETDRHLQGILNIIPLQLLSYHLAVKLGRNVDKPRNLAKSVTTN